MSDESWTLTARWVVPVDGPPLERGTVTVRGEKIEAVEPRGTRTADVDCGNAAILPGLVNAHTHLDLSGARGQLPPTPDFTGWLRRVIAYRRQCSPEKVGSDIRGGIAECLHFGTTLVGDISGDGSSWSSLVAAPLRAVVYREWIGLRQTALADAMSPYEWAHNSPPGDTCVPGVSPHAPYSVHMSLINYTYKSRLRFCIHLAETAAELELIDRHRGPFVRFLSDLGVWNPEGLAPSLKWILVRTRRAKHPVYVHCNYLSADAPFLSAGTVVYCPRTHAAFGHPPHPFRDFLRKGIRVALGTDSLASNPDLDVLAEVRFVHGRHPDVPGDVLLRMATLSGAEALGWAEETGSLTPGKSADLVVLPLPDAAADPYHLVFTGNKPVQAVLFRGRWIKLMGTHGKGPIPANDANE